MNQKQALSKQYAIGGKINHTDSFGERTIKTILDIYGIKYRQEVIKNVHKYDKDYYYVRFDFYLPETKTVIEYNGDQHYHYNPNYHKDKNAFKRQVARDMAVKEYCKDNGFHLIVVRYSAIKYNFSENLLKAIKQKRYRILK